MSFSNLKNNRNKINDLVNAGSELNEKKSFVDDRQWKPTVDKAGNGYSVIRFLPAPKTDVPWVRYWDHAFKGPTGSWYIEKSLTSIGQTDPVTEMNAKLWNTGKDEDKKTVRDRKRRLHYVSNIYVVSDPSAPQNEGKEFLFTFGKKIFDKIMDVMQPQFPDEKPINPFDFWEGANFNLKIRQVEGYRNYDKSEFAKPSPFMDGDDSKLEAIYNTLYDLSEFTDVKNYKSYEELQEKLNKVLGQSVPRSIKDTVALDNTKEPAAVKSAPSRIEEDEDEDPTSYFKRLAEE